MPQQPGETGDQYFARFENTWEPDPDRVGLVRRRTQVTRAPDVGEVFRRDQEDFPTTIQLRRGAPDVEVAPPANPTLAPDPRDYMMPSTREAHHRMWRAPARTRAPPPVPADHAFHTRAATSVAQ